MKKTLFFFTFVFFALIFPSFALAQVPTESKAKSNSWPSGEETGSTLSIIGSLSKAIVPISGNCKTFQDDFLKGTCSEFQNREKYLSGGFQKDPSGSVYSPGLLGIQQKAIALLYDNQLSSEEYVADLLNNMGVPTVSRAYAQGTGYTAMTPFLSFWKVFRNLAYSLYIIMFVVVGIMIMLRTKVNAQTIITIQTALPNLLITLILITFSYAIVGFMIDIMYFLIYFVVYLIASVGIIDASKSITRLMSHSAWSVIFEGRNSIISAISTSLGSVLWNLGSGGLGVAGAVISMVSPMYLMVAVAFAIAMLKLMLALIKSYVMLIVQTITAPVQILMNAIPGSKAFSEWLKKTASYLIPFPVAAGMFILSAVLVGNPTDATIMGGIGGDANPFGVKDIAGRSNVWLPPFTLSDSILNTASVGSADVLTIIGFVIFLMTPAAVKMAQDWLQVKESPYTAEAMSSFGGVFAAGKTAYGWKTSLEHQREATQQLSTQKQMAANLKEIANK